MARSAAHPSAGALNEKREIENESGCTALNQQVQIFVVRIVDFTAYHRTDRIVHSLKGSIGVPAERVRAAAEKRMLRCGIRGATLRQIYRRPEPKESFHRPWSSS